jgi:hypothetical protein
LATPEKFDGQRIVTDGLLFTGEQESYLFLFTEDWRRFRLFNAVMLRFDLKPPTPERWGELLHGKRVEVEGVLRGPSSTVVLPAGGGVLERVTRIYEIKDGVVIEQASGTVNSRRN